LLPGHHRIDVSAAPLPDFEDFTEDTVSTAVVFDGRLLHVRRDEVRLHDGAPAQREYIQHPGAVMMLVFTAPGTVLLERQFRYPRRRHFIELPAGKLNPGEEPLLTGQRELVEECGYTAAEWWKITTVDPCIGYSDEVIHLYGARNLTKVGANLDAGEHLQVFEAKVADALEWIREGHITDTKTCIALLWWAQFGDKR
jgi:ADP-ribose pyrophosphatase